MFISHTSDLGERPRNRSFVRVAVETVTRLGHAVTDMAYFAARDAEPARYCMDMVADADVYVGIIGMRYGSPVGDRPDLSYTELELETATELGLPRLVFLLRQGSMSPAPAQTEEHRIRQEAFRRRLQDEVGVTVGWISSPAELERELVHALSDLERTTPDRPLPPEPRAGIPPDPAAHFTGREAELSDLGSKLSVSGRVAIHGLGGIGKTQLAARYVQRHRNEYPGGVFWLRGDSAGTLTADLASLAWHLDLAERNYPQQELQVTAVLRWLREHTGWLLVIDDLEDDAEQALNQWLPYGLSGSVLLTSRTPRLAVRISLQSLPLDVSIRYLLDRTGQRDQVAAGDVAAALGRLPLALAQAAAYMDVSGRDLSGYSNLLRTRLVELMRQPRAEDYPRTVATTWQLSFERLERDRPTAAALLRLCAFMAPDDIPVNELVRGAKSASKEVRAALEDEVELDRAIAVLRSYSLVHRHADALDVHKLVQLVVRSSLPEDDREVWLTDVTRLLCSAFPEDGESPGKWSSCARLIPHVQALLNAASGYDPAPLAMSRLVDRAGGYLSGRSEYRQARPLMERAVALDERVLGSDHPQTAAAIARLADLLRRQGQMTTARSLHERALAIRERVLGPDHPDTAASLNGLAVLQWEQGEFDAARLRLERALAIRAGSFGPEHPDTALTLSNLANAIHGQGDVAAAKNLHERVLAIREKVLGHEHVDTANSMNNLTVMLLDLGEFDRARQLCEETLTIRERLLGPDHVLVAQTFNNLGKLARAEARLDEALAYFERALSIREKVLGPDHPAAKWTRDTLKEIAGELAQPS